MMGIEPIQAALKAGARWSLPAVVATVAIYAALPVLKGIPKHVAFHAGKILEMPGSERCTAPVPGLLWQRKLDQEGFTVEPPNPALRCTPRKVLLLTLCTKMRIRTTS